MKSEHRRRSGFTLIEMLVVLAIIGMLTALIVGVSAVVSDRAGRSGALSEMARIADALEDYRMDYGAYPESLSSEDFADLLARRGLTINGKGEPVDPWDRPYRYTNTNYAFDLTSDGPVGGANHIVWRR